MGIHCTSLSPTFILHESVIQLVRKILYNILTKFGTPMKLVKLIKVCLNEHTVMSK